MEYTLTHLIDSLQSTLKVLRGGASPQLAAELQGDKLPSKKFEELASRAIDLLHEVEKLLEPSPLVLADHFLGYVNSKCLSAAVKLDVPDVLKAGPKTLHQLATACNARPDRLGQVLRVLYNNGIFAYDAKSGVYSNNRTSELLLSDHWTQWRNWVDLYGNEFYDMARGIPTACSKDVIRMPAQINFDTDLDMFTYFTDRGWLPRLHQTLSGGAVAQAPGILEDYPWDELANRIFLDVGGGGGGLVALVLRKYKDLRAGILDLPRVIQHARTSFHSANGQYYDVGGQVDPENLIAGDFLQEIPGFEVYTMKWCLHDWDNTKAVRILRNIREAIIEGPTSRLVIFESLLTDGRMGRLSRYADITMMVSANGQERDEPQWKALVWQTGWTVKQIYPLRNCWPCAIELIPSRHAVTGADGANRLTGVSMTDGGDTDIDPQETPRTEIGRASGLQGRQITTHMSYLEPWNTTRGEPFYRSVPDEEFESTNFKWVEYPVVVTDARPKRDSYSIDEHAFAFHDDLEPIPDILLDSLRSNHKDTVKRLYYPRIARLLKERIGASQVIIFDHTVRKKNHGLDPKANPDGQEQPAMVVHCDQSTKGALNRLKQNLPEGQDISSVLQHRVKMINVWRPLNGPVESFPLALLDYRSLSLADVHPCNLYRHQYEERGQTVAFTYSSNQRWFYLDGQRTDEITMIKIWDNKEDVTGKFCAHAAFDHPDTPADAAPRESVEVRCFAIWGKT